MTSAPPPAYLDLPVGQFLATLSAATPDPGGGSAAALAAQDRASPNCFSFLRSVPRLSRLYRPRLKKETLRVC